MPLDADLFLDLSDLPNSKLQYMQFSSKREAGRFTKAHTRKLLAGVQNAR